MNCWCRLCRQWVYESHFEVPGQYHRNGCGQGRSDIRYHPERPLCGDVWKLSDGRYVVVDYLDSFMTGLTFSDGVRLGQKYSGAIRDFLERNKASLVSTFEEFPYPVGVDHRGWTDPKYKPDFADSDGSRSLAFIRAVLKRNGVKADL